MHGILLLDKPEGITSNDLVRLVKIQIRPAKVGHSGTLDSAASGLMVILIGAGTRSLDYLDESHKKYSMTVVLGEETDSGDKEGTLVRTEDASHITIDRIEEALRSYRGTIDQIPPHYSAIKKDGVPLYRLARRGVFPELTPRKVEIYSLDIKSWAHPLLEMDMVCSKGTYARAIARDVGNDLGVGGRLEKLRRTASGQFRLEEAITVEDVVSGGQRTIREHLIALPQALAHVPEVKVLPAETRRLMRGNPVAIARSRIPAGDSSQGLAEHIFKVVSGDGRLLILVKPTVRDGEIALRPVKVFNTLEVGSLDSADGSTVEW